MHEEILADDHAQRSNFVRVGVDAHTLGNRQTGNETYVRELIAGLGELADPDTEFVFYHTGRRPLLAAPGCVRRVWPAHPVIRVPVGFPMALHRDRVNVAHFQYISPPVTACPIVVTVHDVSFELHPEFLPRLLVTRLRWLVPLSVRQAAHVVTVSEFTRREIIERYDVHPDQITVTPEAAAPAFRVLENPEALRESLSHLNLPDRFLLAVGNLQPRKNLGTLLEAYATLVRANRIEQKLVLVGQAHYQSHAVFENIARLGIGQHIVWTGYVSQETLVALYNLADLFVFPTLYEGFGLPVVEAMACGTPVVSTMTTSIPEVSGDAAVLVDPRSASEFSTAIERLATSPSLRAELRERGLRRAARYSWKETARLTLEVYKRYA